MGVSLGGGGIDNEKLDVGHCRFAHMAIFARKVRAAGFRKSIEKATWLHIVG